MTTVEIKAEKVAEANLQQPLNNALTNSKARMYHAFGMSGKENRIRWLKALLVAANASEGVVTMSVEDVGKLGEWL